MPLTRVSVRCVHCLARSLCALPPSAPPDPDAAFRSQIAPFLKKHCTECHGAGRPGRRHRGSTSFKDAAAVAADPKTWQRAIEMLRSGAMPPEDAAQPTEAERRQGRELD